MNDISRYPKPFICLVRHGETELSVARRYNGLGDIALTANGENQARSIAASLNNVDWETVLSSPLKRARRTAELAGFASPEIVEGLKEFDYGECEGRTTSEILEKHPGWDFWHDGCPGGETLKKAGRRLDGVIEKLHSYKGAVLVFSHSHAIRILTARWLGLAPELAATFASEPAHINVVGTHRGRPIILLWNDGSHLGRAREAKV